MASRCQTEAKLALAALITKQYIAWAASDLQPDDPQLAVRQSSENDLLVRGFDPDPPRDVPAPVYPRSA